MSRTLSELQETLSECIDKVLNGDLQVDVAKTVSSLAAAKISGERAKLRYAVIRKEMPKSAFLEG